MRTLRWIFATILVASCTFAAAQNPAPTPYFSVNCIKVKPGKSAEFGKWAQDTLHKYAQARADSGAVALWYRLRAVQPAGSTNECDQMIATFFPGNPPKPLETQELDALLKKSGASVSVEQYREQINAMTDLAASGIYQQVAVAGSPSQKGDYLLINYNKAIDVDKWVALEKKVWMPFAEELTKAGITRGWGVDLRVVPSGPALKYDGVTVDVFPTYDGFFSFPTNPKLEELWKKVHPDLTFEQAFTDFPKVTTQILRELWVVEDVVSGQKQTSQNAGGGH